MIDSNLLFISLVFASKAIAISANEVYDATYSCSIRKDAKACKILEEAGGYTIKGEEVVLHFDYHDQTPTLSKRGCVIKQNVGSSCFPDWDKPVTNWYGNGVQVSISGSTTVSDSVTVTETGNFAWNDLVSYSTALGYTHSWSYGSSCTNGFAQCDVEHCIGVVNLWTCRTFFKWYDCNRNYGGETMCDQRSSSDNNNACPKGETNLVRSHVLPARCHSAPVKTSLKTQTMCGIILDVQVKDYYLSGDKSLTLGGATIKMDSCLQIQAFSMLISDDSISLYNGTSCSNKVISLTLPRPIDKMVQNVMYTTLEPISNSTNNEEADVTLTDYNPCNQDSKLQIKMYLVLLSLKVIYTNLEMLKTLLLFNLTFVNCLSTPLENNNTLNSGCIVTGSSAHFVFSTDWSDGVSDCGVLSIQSGDRFYPTNDFGDYNDIVKGNLGWSSLWRDPSAPHRMCVQPSFPGGHYMVGIDCYESLRSGCGGPNRFNPHCDRS
ncbi:hypothetical protein HDV06_000815 [Boothiomyces sp. JEL0866]|nr:hypothetical protein HDV06_000815 [Boothiomyces sp. JEL0866]